MAINATHTKEIGEHLNNSAPCSVHVSDATTLWGGGQPFMGVTIPRPVMIKKVFVGHDFAELVHPTMTSVDDS